MTTIEYESLLDRCCEILTAEARSAGFVSSKQFEDRVRQVLDELTQLDSSINIDYNSPAQAFPIWRSVSLNPHGNRKSSGKD